MSLKLTDHLEGIQMAATRLVKDLRGPTYEERRGVLQPSIFDDFVIAIRLFKLGGSSTKLLQ